MTNQAAAGWYHAQGDPPGTVRYWDGSQWVGEPQHTPGQATQEAVPFQPPSTEPYGGGWSPRPTLQKGGIGARLGAYIIDVIIGVLPIIVVAIVAPDSGALNGLAFLATAGIVIWNVVLRQGGTGQSVGKGVTNVTLLTNDTLQPIGGGKALGRLLLGWVLNSIFPIDYIWALFDKQNQRLVDKILNSNVYQA